MPHSMQIFCTTMALQHGHAPWASSVLHLARADWAHTPGSAFWPCGTPKDDCRLTAVPLAAGIKCDVIETQHRDHAINIILETAGRQLGTLDGVILVSAFWLHAWAIIACAMCSLKGKTHAGGSHRPTGMTMQNWQSSVHGNRRTCSVIC